MPRFSRVRRFRVVGVVLLAAIGIPIGLAAPAQAETLSSQKCVSPLGSTFYFNIYYSKASGHRLSVNEVDVAGATTRDGKTMTLGYGFVNVLTENGATLIHANDTPANFRGTSISFYWPQHYYAAPSSNKTMVLVGAASAATGDSCNMELYYWN